MRALGHAELHSEVASFLRALALEAGSCHRAGKALPGTPMAAGRYSIDIFKAAILVSYSPHPDTAEIRVIDLVWLRT